MKTVIVKQTETERIASFLLAGEIVAFPTETVFGLAVIASNYESYLKLLNLKKRPKDKQLPLLVNSDQQINEYAKVNSQTKKVIEAFLPGPLTLVLFKKEDQKNRALESENTIAIRWSNCPYLKEVLDKVNEPLFLTSANISSVEVSKNSKEVYNIFKDKIACIVEGESGSLASTIVDLSKDRVDLIRQGEITLDEIRKVRNEV